MTKASVADGLISLEFADYEAIYKRIQAYPRASKEYLGFRAPYLYETADYGLE